MQVVETAVLPDGDILVPSVEVDEFASKEAFRKVKDQAISKLGFQTFYKTISTEASWMDCCEPESLNAG